MIPVLYESTETEFTSNGIGRLSDAISCVTTEERNGQYEVEMEYPVDGIHFSDLKVGRIICCTHDTHGDRQPFEIYKITKESSRRYTILAHHITYRASGIPVLPFVANSASVAMVGLKEHAAVDCPFTLRSDVTTVARYNQTKPQSLRGCLGGSEGSILDTFGGEYEWDGFDIILRHDRGSDTGVEIRYGKNLTDLKQEESIEATYTGICPYWAGSVNDEDTCVTLPEKVLLADNASAFPYPKVEMVDISSSINLPEGQEEPTEDEVRKAAQSYMKKHSYGVPKVSLTVSFADLSKTEDYKDFALTEDVNLCDTVTVKYEKLGVSAKAKVIETEWNVLTDSYDSISLGEARTDLSDTIAAAEKSQKEVPDTIAKVLDESKKRTNEKIKDMKNLEGYAFVHYDDNGKPFEFIVADSDSLASAKKVWRWNEGGLAYSSTGYNGDYSAAAITADGEICADFISTGVLAAGLIKAGILQDVKGTNYWNMETGEFRLAAQTKVGDSTIASADDVSAADKNAKGYADAAEKNAKGYTDAAEKSAKDYADSAREGLEKGMQDYADGAAKAAVNAQKQEDIFNKLTNNGQTQGIYLQDGKLYINADYIRSGSMSTAYLHMNGYLAVYDQSKEILGGIIGYMNGYDEGGPTDGIGIHGTKNRYLLITNTANKQGINIYNEGTSYLFGSEVAHFGCKRAELNGGNIVTTWDQTHLIYLKWDGTNLIFNIDGTDMKSL